MESQTFIDDAYHMDVISNQTQTGNDTGVFAYSSHSLPEIVTLGVIFIIVIIWTVFGNLTVIVSVRKNKTLRASPSNILIGNLALSDLLLGLTVLPFSAMFDIFGYWPIGQELCFMWLITDVLLCTASIWSLLVIAVDRYTATFYPIWYRSEHQSKRIIIYIAVVWVVSTVTSIPPLFGFGSMTRDSYDDAVRRTMCVLFANLDFVLYSSAMTFVVPAVVLFILYGKIFAELRKRSKKRMIMKAQMINQSGGKLMENQHEEDIDHESTSSSNNQQATQDTDVHITHNPLADWQEAQDQVVCEEEFHALQNGEDTAREEPQEETKLAQEEGRKNSTGLGRKRQSIKRASQYLKKIRLSTASIAQRKRNDRKEKREERATKIMLTVMIIFIVCWMPFFAMYITRSIIRKLCPNCMNIPDALQGFLIWLGYINSAINPLLYTAFNKQFRTAFTTVWCQICCRNQGQRTKTHRNAQRQTSLTFDNTNKHNKNGICFR